MKKFLTKLLIAFALMPLGYVLGVMLAFSIVDIVGLMSVEQTPIATKPPAPAQIEAAPPARVPQPPPQMPQIVPPPGSPGINGSIPNVLCWENRSGCGCNISCEKQI
jgi:hypothetical protein